MFDIAWVLTPHPPQFGGASFRSVQQRLIDGTAISDFQQTLSLLAAEWTLQLNSLFNFIHEAVFLFAVRTIASMYFLMIIILLRCWVKGFAEVIVQVRVEVGRWKRRFQTAVGR